MKVTIDQTIPQVTFPAPGVRKEQVEVHFTTGNGVKGTVVLDKADATQAGILAAIKASVEHLDKLVGTTVEIK